MGKLNIHGKQQLKQVETARRQQMFQQRLLLRPEICAPTSLNWAGVALLMLVLSAGAVSAYQTVSSPTTTSGPAPKKPAGKSITVPSSIEVEAHNICTDASYLTFNKANITLGAQQGMLAPQSCLDGPQFFTCQDEWRQFHQFRLSPSISDKFFEAREKAAQLYNDWAKELTKGLVSISESDPTLQQNKDIGSLLGALNTLKINTLRAEYTEELQGGNCDELTADALVKLINKNLSYKGNMDIKVIGMSNSKSAHWINGHTCLLLNSDCSDVRITKNKSAVTKFLNSIQTGKICDPWNRGLYQDIRGTKNGLYNAGAEWDSLSVETVSLDLEKIHALPRKVRKFFVSQFHKMGITIPSKRSFGLFAATQDTVTSPSVSSQPQDVTFKKAG